MIDQQQVAECRHSELAVGWALHVLEPAEEILVAAHLPDCAECTRTVAETELVGATLGLSVPEETPSAALEERVLAITSTPQVFPARPERPTPPPEPQLAPQPAAQPVAETLSRPPRKPVIRPPGRMPRRRSRREPLCFPETLKLISIALLVFIFAAVVVFYAVP